MLARVAAHLMLSLSAFGALAADAYSPPTPDAFVAAIRNYPFVANPARRAKLRAGVPQLTRCMSPAEVRRLIGDPDFGYVAFKAGVPSKKLWSYVLEKKTLAEVEASSRVVAWFGNDGKLQAITVHGAPDIESNISRRATACP